jgi:MYXO-CTERM domain-containing protein
MMRLLGVSAGVLTVLAAGEARAVPAVVAEVALPGAPFDGIAVTPDGSTVYVSVVQAKNPGLNAIAVIDADSNTVVDTIDLGDQGADSSSPRQLYLAPDGGLLIHSTYVDNLIVIDTATDTVQTILPGVGSAVAVFTPDSAQLWSRDSASKSLQVYDTVNNSMTLLATFPLLSPGSSDFPLVITPDGARVYGVSSNEGGNGFNNPVAVDSFDVAGLATLAHYGVGLGDMGNALVDARVAPDGAHMYTSCALSTRVARIELASDTVVNTADVPLYGEGLSLSPDGETLYVFENGYMGGLMRVYEAATLSLLKTVDVNGQSARFLATSRQSVFAPSGCAVIVPGPLMNQIFALDPATHEKIASFATPGGTAYTVAFNNSSTRAYLPWRTDGTHGNLTVLDLGEGCAALPGDPCVDNAECGGLACIDGVCCDSPCGDGATDDCQACSVAEGAAVDGTCGPVGAGANCRPADASCDVAEVCDGEDVACPPDAFVADGAPCDGGACIAGTCEAAGTSTSGSVETTGGGGTTGAVESTGPAPTSGEPIDSDSDGISGTGGGEASTGGAGVPTSGGGEASSDGGSGSDTAGETIDDGCGCATSGGRAPWLVLLVMLPGRRRRVRSDRHPERVTPG